MRGALCSQGPWVLRGDVGSARACLGLQKPLQGVTRAMEKAGSGLGAGVQRSHRLSTHRTLSSKAHLPLPFGSLGLGTGERVA